MRHKVCGSAAVCHAAQGASFRCQGQKPLYYLVSQRTRWHAYHPLAAKVVFGREGGAAHDDEVRTNAEQGDANARYAGE